MPTQLQNEARTLLNSERFEKARTELLAVIADASQKLRQIRPSPSSPEIQEQYLETVRAFQRHRGRDLYFPFLSSGLGAGPFVELADGSVKYDLITGIGINFFGHSHPEIMAEAIRAIPSDIMQGNLEPGIEAAQLLDAMLSRVAPVSRLKHGWLMCSGTMVNEVALKIVRQKRQPATKIIAFRDCFAGRSTAMQEITDNPKYREGQPVYGEVEYIPFFDAKLGLQKSIDATLAVFQEHVTRYPGRFAALMLEIVQGEGGFSVAPREFYVALFEAARKAGLAIWADEIQSFGRTGELFAFQVLKLETYIDVVTVAKMLQASMVLYTEEYNPKAGLVAGTFSGSAVALRAARRSLELLDEGKYLGAGGKVAQLSGRFFAALEKLKTGSCRGQIGEIRGIGGMIAFEPFQGTLDDCKAVLMKLFDLGVVAFYCGHGPYLIRMLPPLGAMSESDIDQVCQLIDQALCAVAQERAQVPSPKGPST